MHSDSTNSPKKRRKPSSRRRKSPDKNGHQAVHPLHLLIALAAEREGIVRPVLEKCGVQPDALITEAERQLDVDPQSHRPADPACTSPRR